MQQLKFGFFCGLVALCMSARAQDVDFWLAFGDSDWATVNGKSVGDPLDKTAANNVTGLSKIRVRLMAKGINTNSYATGGAMISFDRAGTGPVDFASTADFDAAATYGILRMTGLSVGTNIFLPTGLPGVDNSGNALTCDASFIGNPKLSCAQQILTGPRDVGFWAGFGYGLGKNLKLNAGVSVPVCDIVLELNLLKLLAEGGIYGDQANHTGIRLFGHPTAPSRKTYLGPTAGTANATTVTYSISTVVVGNPPVALPDGYNVAEDNSLSAAAPGVLANDSDPDAGDTIKAVLQTPPAHAASFALNADGSFNYVPVANYAGTDTFRYRAQDQHGVSSSAAVVTITVTPVNDPPRVGQPGPATSTELTQATYQILADDNADNPPNLPLKYSLTTGPQGMTIDGQGLITFTPTEEQGPGDYPVIVKVEDSGDPVLSTSVTFQWHVNEANQLPILNDFTPLRSHPGAKVEVQAVATDADLPAQDLHYTITSANYGATISGSAGLFTWDIPSDQAKGPYNFEIEVTDGAGGSAHKTLHIHVANDPNQPPVLDLIGERTVVGTTTLSFTAVANDPDKDELSYSIISGPNGATIDPQTGKFSWKTTVVDVGTHSCTIQVTEVGTTPALTDSETFNIVVTDAPAQISGVATLRDLFASPANQRLTFELRDANNAVVQTFTDVALDADGKYALETSQVGIFALVARGSTWVGQSRYPVTLVSGQAAVVNYSLNNGDCNGDNKVTVEDLPILEAAYDTSQGGAGYDIRADLNQDGYVGTDDYLIFNENYGQEGA